MLQSLVPSVEHAEEADLGSKVAWIAGDLQQSCSAGVKQQVIDQPFILQGERSEFPRQGEDDVRIAGGQQLPLPRLEPAQTGVALTLGAVPVSARVVRDGSMSAVRALIAMSTQRGGAAARDGQQPVRAVRYRRSGAGFCSAPYTSDEIAVAGDQDNGSGAPTRRVGETDGRSPLEPGFGWKGDGAENQTRRSSEGKRVR